MIDPNEHPAPDLLAALPQGLLTDSERSTVLHHLAECSNCRHSVMFLAEREKLHKPGPKWRGSRPLTVWAIAAAAVAFFTVTFTFVSAHSTTSRSETQSGTANIAYLPAVKSHSFAHVRLTRSGDSVETGALTIHLAGFKPKENQVVVRSQYGDRWLTFDSFLSLATSDGSVSTVN